MRVLRGFSFFIRLLKSKAQIGLGRYEGFFLRGALLGCWPFLEFMVVY
jgi:hypothetical protein